jgi:hypothetical protein
MCGAIPPLPQIRLIARCSVEKSTRTTSPYLQLSKFISCVLTQGQKRRAYVFYTAINLPVKDELLVGLQSKPV